MENPSLDALDIGIIRALQEDGRKPFTEIADTLGVSERTIRVRVTQLKESNVLQIIGIVNPITIGLKLVAMIQISAHENQLEKCIEKLTMMDEVRFVTLTSGEYHLVIEVISRSHDEFSEFVTGKLNKLQEVRSTNITMELKIVKNSFKFLK